MNIEKLIKSGAHFGHPASKWNPNFKKFIDNIELNKLMEYRFPSGFVAIAKPIGWEYAKTLKGDQEKYDKNKIIEEGPVIEL